MCARALTADSRVPAPEEREADGAAERGRAAGHGGHGAGQGAHSSGETWQPAGMSCLFPLEIQGLCLSLITTGKLSHLSTVWSTSYGLTKD